MDMTERADSGAAQYKQTTKRRCKVHAKEEAESTHTDRIGGGTRGERPHGEHMQRGIPTGQNEPQIGGSPIEQGEAEHEDQKRKTKQNNYQCKFESVIKYMYYQTRIVEHSKPHNYIFSIYQHIWLKVI